MTIRVHNIDGYSRYDPVRHVHVEIYGVALSVFRRLDRKDVKDVRQHREDRRFCEEAPWTDPVK